MRYAVVIEKANDELLGLRAGLCPGAWRPARPSRTSKQRSARPFGCTSRACVKMDWRCPNRPPSLNTSRRNAR